MPDSWNDADKVLRGARFDVFAVDLDQRTGGTHRREVVVPADAVIIVPMLDDDTVVLIRNERFAVGQTLWELPAGTMEAGEDPAASAARELTEETGYVAAKIQPLCDFYTTPGFCTERMYAFEARGLTLQAQHLDETEKITVEVMPISRAIDLIRNNTIRDGKTIAALLYALTFREYSRPILGRSQGG